METWLRELRSPPEEGPLRSADRQVRAGFRLLNRDRTIRAIVVFGALALTGLWVAFYLLARQTGPLDREADQVFRQLLYWAASVGVSLLVSLAVACAADAKIDGVSDQRLLFEDVRRRLPALFCWWLLSMAASAGLELAAAEVMQPLFALLAVALLLGVGTFFVIPAIVIGDGRPRETVGMALHLLRLRWGRALVGLLTIGFVYGLVWIAAGFVLRAGVDRQPHDPGENLGIVVGALALGYLGYAIATAARECFALILARDVLGDLPGEPAPVKPRRRARVIAGRIALGLVCLVVLVGLLGAIFGHRARSKPANPSGTAGHGRTERFVAYVEDPKATLLVPEAPVVLAGKAIGYVSMVDVKRPPPAMPQVVVAFYADPRYALSLAHSRPDVLMRDGRAYLVVVRQ